MQSASTRKFRKLSYSDNHVVPSENLIEVKLTSQSSCNDNCLLRRTVSSAKQLICRLQSQIGSTFWRTRNDDVLASPMISFVDFLCFLHVVVANARKYLPQEVLFQTKSSQQRPVGPYYGILIHVELISGYFVTQFLLSESAAEVA